MTGIGQPGDPPPTPQAAGLFGSLSTVATALGQITQAIYKLATYISTSAIGGVVGGDLSGTLPNPIVAQASGAFTTKAARIHNATLVVAAGAYNVTSTDEDVFIKKTVGAATAVNLPSSPATGRRVMVKDAKGDALINPITITPAAGTIDGQPTLVIGTPYQRATLEYNSTEWSQVS